MSRYMGLYDGGRATVEAVSMREAKFKLVKRFNIPEAKQNSVAIVLLPRKGEIGKFQTEVRYGY